MTSVLSVLRSGGDFNVAHVARLAHQLREHSPPGTPFVCLTDDAMLGADFARPLQHDWPGWWSKIETYRISGPCLYLDLDVTVVGDLTPLLKAAAEHELVMLKDFWLEGPHRVNSSVVGWRGNVSGIYEEFATAPIAMMSLYSTKVTWGDQRFVADTYAGEPALWQDVCPGMCVSFKRGALMGADLSNLRVLVSHGQPRPWARDGADAWLAQRSFAQPSRVSVQDVA